MNSIFDRRNNTFGWTVVIMYIHDYAHFLSHTQFHLKVYVFVSAHNAVTAICAGLLRLTQLNADAKSLTKKFDTKT